MEVGPYWLGKTLGEGSTCKVKLGLHRKTEDVVAIKILSKKKLSSKPRMRLKVDREMAVMRLIDHPNVLKLKDVYETPRHLFLVTEYAENGEVFDYLVKRGQLSEWEARRLFLQLVHGLLYCKRHLICHRDLKPENLLLDKYNNLKIADFGMASLNREDAMLKTSCGSPHYASPEIVRGDEYDGFKSDVWSCGVILYALLAGYLPFDDDDIRKLLEMVRDGEYEMPTSMPHGARDLIEHMLVVDPERRYSLEDVVAHPWLTSHASGMALARLAPPVEVDRDTPITSADPWVLSNLIAIGFATDDKQLRTVLSSPGPRIEKVFYRLLEARRDQCQQARQRSRSMDPQTSPLSVPDRKSVV